MQILLILLRLNTPRPPTCPDVPLEVSFCPVSPKKKATLSIHAPNFDLQRLNRTCDVAVCKVSDRMGGHPRPPVILPHYPAVATSHHT